MANTNKSTFYVIGSMICWALSFVWVKIAYDSFGPISTIFLRLIISTAILFSFLALTRKLQTIKKEDYKLILLISFFEPFMYFMAESYGIQLVSSTLAAVIISTVPLFASIFAFLFYKERITTITIIGIATSFLGVGILIFENGFELNASLLGILLMFLAVFCCHWLFNYTKKFSSKIFSCKHNCLPKPDWNIYVCSILFLMGI